MKKSTERHDQMKKSKEEEYRIKISELLERMDSKKLRYYYIFIIQREKCTK